MHEVEVRRPGDDIAGPMAQMRTWLDAKAVRPAMFRMSLLPSATVFYVEFSTTREARAFARAVGGTLILESKGQTQAA
ncbi:MAG: hypothetical protein JO162_05135 [Alphaproteobacteria bacterium]|nr:hypothetical protein [Alphaproteobacteria bacterium]